VNFLGWAETETTNEEFTIHKIFAVDRSGEERSHRVCIFAIVGADLLDHRDRVAIVALEDLAEKFDNRLVNDAVGD